MCGIFGFNFEDKKLLKKMGSALEHRGPDGSGYYSDSDISLGHRRLKIIDLSENAKQPMTNENGDIWLTYNGEIYNFKRLRKELESLGHEFKSNTDSEVIVHGYEEWGSRVIDKFRGIFAFAIYDSIKKCIFLGRDRIGVKPLYYHFDGNKFIFASEIKAIHQDVQPQLDLEALDEFFTFQYTLCPRTLFRGIKKLRPGHIIEFDLRKKELKEDIYWDLRVDIADIEYKSEEFFIKKIEEKIKEAIKLRLISDVPLGIYLSGGLDSSYIAAVARELKDDVKAYTVSFSGEDEDESRFASLVAEHIGIDHKVIPIKAGQIELIPEVTWHLDKPAVDIASIPLYVMAKASKKYLTVALMGDGGDEIFAGYEKYRLMMMREKAKLLPEQFRLLLSSLLPVKKENKGRLKEFLANKDAVAYLSYISSFSLDERKKLFTQGFSQQQLGKVEQYFNKNPLQDAFFFDIKTLLPDDYLMKVDKATMANAIEARVPYLDHELIELAMTIPPGYKLNGLKTKAFFRKVVKRKLLKEIVERKKHGFNVPTKRWLDSGLDEVAYQLIDTAPDIISRDYAKRVVRNFKKNPRYYSRQFWSIFTFILWYKMYFETEKPKFDINYYVS